MWDYMVVTDQRLTHIAISHDNWISDKDITEIYTWTNTSQVTNSHTLYRLHSKWPHAHTHKNQTRWS